MPGWLSLALEAIKLLPTVEQGISHFLQALHNEQTAGSGQTDPVGVVTAALDAASEIGAAVVENTGSAPAAPPPPPPPPSA